MIKLSAVIITLNEEKNIRRCIESLKPVADEILVVDDGKIKGIGNHDELIKTNEIYQEIYNTQQKGVLE